MLHIICYYYSITDQLLSPSYLVSLVGAATSIIFVARNICRDKHNFVMTKVLLRRTYFCRNRHMFTTAKHIFCHEKSKTVATKVLSQCRNKTSHGKHNFVATNVFVVTSILLLWQKTCFVIQKPRRWWKTEKLIKKKNYFPIKQIAFKLKI